MGHLNNYSVLFPPWYCPTWSLQFDAFKVDRYINSQPNSRPDQGSPDVAHSGVPGLIPGVSRAGVPVWDYITFPSAMIAAANKGKGWHLMTAVEWAILAEWSRLNGTMPHGGNANTNPPADVTYTSEVAQLDAHLHGENAAYHRALPGTGPNTWAHNHKENGVWDLQGLTWQWLMGLAGVGTDWTANGYPRILAKTDLKYGTSAFGRGTISGSGGATPTLTCDGAGVNWLKAWTADEFNTMYIYIAEAAAGAGAWYTITDTTATTIILTAADAPGNGTATFYVAKVISHDITAGMTSGHNILTLEDANADLKPFAIPATADATGSNTYGKDIYYYSKGAETAARRGGSFYNVASAGVFALDLTSRGDANIDLSFRACKCL